MTLDTFAGSKVRHGTNSGWRLHQMRGDERPCDPCYFAKQEYDRRRLSATPLQQRNRDHAKAQQRALKRLKNLYPAAYAVLYAEAKAEIAKERQHDPQALRRLVTS